MIDELRRRKVLRSTTIYAVSGWCLLQWSDLVFNRLGWPDWSVTLVLTAVVLGFPVTVALAWLPPLRSSPPVLMPKVRLRMARLWLVLPQDSPEKL